MPLANALVTPDELGRPEDRFPLVFAFCSNCALAQITEPVSPDRLFRDYSYFSSVSDAMVDHARRLVEHVIPRAHLDETSLVVELASNDGYLLQHYVSKGVPVLVIDPAANVAVAALERGVPTLTEFFGVEMAEEMARAGQLADVVHANNVLAHVPDIHGFIRGIATILRPGGVAVIETPYVRELVDRLEFDTIYHEHVYYYSLTSLTRLFERHGLRVVDVERVPIHGGSLRVYATRGRQSPSSSVSELLEDEAATGVPGLDYYAGFGDRVRAMKRELLDVLADLKSRGASIAAYGAAAKGAVLLNAFGIGADIVDFVADRSPHKQGFFMPGVHIPIVPAERLAEAMPEATLLLAWNFEEEILEQQREYRRRGGRFVVPGPTIRVV
jgi:SAM-dependent methyltransferase